MNKKKIILLFSDLEGTLLRESDGKFEPEDMYSFLSELYKLQELKKAKIHLHLVTVTSSCCN